MAKKQIGHQTILAQECLGILEGSGGRLGRQLQLEGRVDSSRLTLEKEQSGVGADLNTAHPRVLSLGLWASGCFISWVFTNSSREPLNYKWGFQVVEE